MNKEPVTHMQHIKHLLFCSISNATELTVCVMHTDVSVNIMVRIKYAEVSVNLTVCIMYRCINLTVCIMYEDVSYKIN